MTPTIITANSLARAAEEYSSGIAEEPLHLATSSSRFRREAAAAGRDLFRRGEVRSHLPEEGPREFAWRMDRERYRFAHGRRPARDDRGPTRAAGRASTGRGTRGRGRGETPAPAFPALGLGYSLRAGEGISVSLSDRSERMGEIRRNIERARYHLARCRDLVAASERRSLSPEERRDRVTRAIRHLSLARDLSAEVESYSAEASPDLAARLERFLRHPAWERIGSSVTRAAHRCGVA